MHEKLLLFLTSKLENSTNHEQINCFRVMNQRHFFITDWSECTVKRYSIATHEVTGQLDFPQQQDNVSIHETLLTFSSSSVCGLTFTL